jgi:hypothetical protein
LVLNYKAFNYRLERLVACQHLKQVWYLIEPG